MKHDPYLDAGMKGWLFTTAKRSFWRVSSWYELDDLVQEGYLCYYKCHRRYTFLTAKRHPSKTDRRRFMALVMAAFTNHIITLSRKRSDGNEMLGSALGHCEESLMSVLERYAPGTEGDGAVTALLAKAPPQVAEFIKLATTGTPKYYRGARLGHRRRLRETTNQHYTRLMGFGPYKVNVVGQVRAHVLG